ncbi:MAG: folate-binding protein YgfZ [Rhodospirillales bacterium]|nr:folate-binding protein YgfZ [Rhodospirillales bacterium]
MKAMAVRLTDRALLKVAGEERAPFLQGLISNDTRKLSPERALFAALLTPQGKFLFDLFLAEAGDAVWIDGEAARLADLKKRLSLYKLKAKVSIELAPDWIVVAAFGPDAPAKLGLGEAGQAKPFAGGIAFADPRLAEAGLRLILPAPGGLAPLVALGFAEGSAADFRAHRYRLGLPEGSADQALEKDVLLELGYDELNGVDFDKGCYMGQELTARTKYRGLVKKRLVPVTIDGPQPPPGSPIVQDGQEAGELRVAENGLGLALIRLEKLDSSGSFECEGAKLAALRPAWYKSPAV